jgi:hypothetical protein
MTTSRLALAVMRLARDLVLAIEHRLSKQLSIESCSSPGRRIIDPIEMSQMMGPISRSQIYRYEVRSTLDL